MRSMSLLVFSQSSELRYKCPYCIYKLGEHLPVLALGKDDDCEARPLCAGAMSAELGYPQGIRAMKATGKTSLGGFELMWRREVMYATDLHVKVRNALFKVLRILSGEALSSLKHCRASSRP